MKGIVIATSFPEAPASPRVADAGLDVGAATSPPRSIDVPVDEHSVHTAGPVDVPSSLPRRMSARDLSDYRVCPRRVWFRKIAKAQPRQHPTPDLMLGNAVHAALERFFGLRLEDREPAEETLHRCLRAVWVAHRKPGTFVTREEEQAYGLKGLQLLSNFAQRFDTTAEPLGRERWVDVRLPNGVILFGKVDRIDGRADDDSLGTLDVIDFKSGKFRLDDDDLRDEPAAQVYLLATEAEYGRDVERVRFIYLDSGQEARWQPEREDVDDLRDRLVELTDVMCRDREFEARPGQACERCPFAHLCPEAGRVELCDLEVPDDISF